MARGPRRDIVTPEGGFFHVFNRVAGTPGYLPFRKPRIRRRFLNWFRHCLRRSCLQAAAFTLMGNHYHLILLVEPFRRLAQSQLEHFARLRWGPLWKARTRFWNQDRWHKFNQDLFCLDTFMRDFQGSFATWCNRLLGRHGHLWADRYKSLKLEDLQALQECLFYVELNPVRAGLTTRPEQWKYGSAYLRYTGQDHFLIPLSQLFANAPASQRVAFYRNRLLYRGCSPSRYQQQDFPPEIVAFEQARGFPGPGVYLKRLRFLTDGLVLGTAQVIDTHLQRLWLKGRFRRKRSPVAQLGGLFFTLRQQRSRLNC